MKFRLSVRLFKESITMALNSLASNKLRSFLSVLGISIGIFAIVIVFTLVDSLEKNIKSSVQSLGKNVVYVDKWEWVAGSNDYPWWKYVNRPSAQLIEIKDLKKQPINNLIDAISFTSNERSNLKADKNSVENVNVNGYTSDFSKIQALDITEGRFFNELEDNHGTAVAILGANVANGLFPGETKIEGNTFTAFSKQVKVIGVLKNQGDNIINIDFDDNIIVPIKFLQYAAGKNDNTNLIIKAKDNISIDELTNELKGSMRSIRRLKPVQDDNFALNKISFLSDSISEFFGSVKIFGLIIGMFSLLVGGFGVANIMFVSVKERTSQIGIQKSLGAKNEFILLQFLTEAVVLSILGGIVGILFTWGMAVGGNFVLENFMDSTFKIVLTLNNCLMGITFASIIGLLAGIIPAKRASSLVPVEAIRS